MLLAGTTAGQQTGLPALCPRSSLVSTNEHLLQELDRARALHGAEVQQLHWSYQALKRTLGLSPHGSTHPPCAT